MEIFNDFCHAVGAVAPGARWRTRTYDPISSGRSASKVCLIEAAKKDIRCDPACRPGGGTPHQGQAT